VYTFIQPSQAPLETADEFLQFRSQEEIFDSYLKSSPLAHALYRAAEANHFRALKIKKPVLDLGCGFGQFSRAAVRNRIDVGIDISEKQLAKVRLAGQYEELHQADARKLPFDDCRFRSVLSVSVLEHIPDPRAVIAEVFRVLQPGGQFFCSVALSTLHDYLFYPKLFAKIGLSGLGRLYLRWQDRVFRHNTLLSQQVWEGILKESGFEIVHSRPVVSAQVTRLWDLLLLTAIPNQLAGALGFSLVWHPRWFRVLLIKKFKRMLEADNGDGSTLLFVAKKPGE
jgi:ubiquinone/menaquinone biosynthesis C-methylase UbiE